MRRICRAPCIGLLVALVASPALAKVISIPDFTTDPSGLGYTIQAMSPGYGATSNVDTISLGFNATDPETGTQHMLGMNWAPIDENLPSQAGWSLIFGSDPDLRNHTLKLSIRPPGGGPGVAAGGMTSVEVRIVDANGLSCGGWGFNTDQWFAVPPGMVVPMANDPLALGQAPVPYLAVPPQLASMAQGVLGGPGPAPFVHNVTINIGLGPVAGSATVVGPLGALIAPNYLIATAGGNLANAARLDFYESGVLAGNFAIPLNGPQNLNNWWTNIQLTGPPPAVAEPAALGLLGLGLLALRRRSR